MKTNIFLMGKVITLCSLILLVAGGAVYANSEEGRSSLASMWSSDGGGSCPIMNVASLVGFGSTSRVATASTNSGCGVRPSAVAAEYPTCGAPVAFSADFPVGGMPVALASKEDCEDKESCEGKVCPVTGAALASSVDFPVCGIPVSVASKEDCEDKDACEGKVCPVTGAVAHITSDIVAEAAKDETLQTFVLAIQKAGLTELLRTQSPITVFAPADGAFDRLDSGQLAALMDDPDELRVVLMRHVVAEDVCSQNARSVESVHTVYGNDMRLATLEGCETLTANGANVLKSDLVASNGRLHIIDQVLFDDDPHVDVAVLSMD